VTGRFQDADSRSFKTQISAQEKIAELESRIAALEAWRAVNSAPVRTRYRVTRYTGPVDIPGVFGESWRKMWHYFDEVMKKL